MSNEMWPKRAQVEVNKVEQKLEKQQLCTAVHTVHARRALFTALFILLFTGTIHRRNLARS